MHRAPIKALRKDYSHLFILILAFLSTAITGCSRPTTLEAIEQEGTLHVLTRNGPTTYFEGRDGPAGFDYELSQMFADHLGVELRTRIINDLDEVYEVLDQNYTHFAALGLSQHAVKANTEHMQFSKDYMSIQPLILFRNGNKKPKKMEELVGQSIVVAAHTAPAKQLEYIRKNQLPGLKWQEIDDIETAGLMQMVATGEADITIVNSIEFAVHQAIFPLARKAFPLSKPLKISWIFPPGEDVTLLEEANKFLIKAEDEGKLIYLQEKYFGHVDQLGYVGARTFINHIKERLPVFEDIFKTVASEVAVDWRLLAAMGYQESHWRPRATSPTGVRGLMMLTRVTAKEMGVSNRLDPEQSIRGGASYFKMIKRRIAQQIPEPDRTWMALASYNVGYGHLQDARTITKQQGFDANNWIDVKKHLPLLQKKQWYSKTRYGYARGWEPVHYVQNIRRYYDVLAWLTKTGTSAGRFAQTDDSNTILKEDLTDPSPDIPIPFTVTPPML